MPTITEAATSLSRARPFRLLLAALPLASCASIVSDAHYPVTFESSPSGARIEITDQAGRSVQTGWAPFTTTLRASAGFFDGESYTLRASLDGYADTLTTVSARLDGWYIGNLLFGGLIGCLLVDPGTGAMWKLPERVEVEIDRSSPLIPKRLRRPARD